MLMRQTQFIIRVQWRLMKWNGIKPDKPKLTTNWKFEITVIIIKCGRKKESKFNAVNWMNFQFGSIQLQKANWKPQWMNELKSN